MSEFIYGSYRYTYSHVRQNRKTLSVTVYPDMKIVLKSPEEASQERIEQFLRRKWMWLEKQLRFFKKYKRKIYEREYITGESFLYLGKLYTLQVKKGSTDEVVYYKGKLFVYTTEKVTNSEHTKLILRRWYRRRAQAILNQRYSEVFKKFDYDSIPELRILKMPKRWGSFISKKAITLNPELIKAPIECIDYVIIHELCHMKYKDHSKNYFDYLEKMCPNWKELKEKLELRIC